MTPSIQLGVKSNIAPSSFPRRRESSISIVIPVFDYMDVVGMATQEAKAESRYPVNTRTLYFFKVAYTRHPDLITLI